MRGLVLEGGGIKGSYQVGSYYALKKCGIRFDGYAGTSIGSFNAAALACGKYKELLNFWYNLDLAKVLGLSEKFIDDYNTNKRSFTTLKDGLKDFKKILKNHGIKYEGLMEEASKVVNYDDLVKSKADFGLVTVMVSMKKIGPKYIYKEDIKNQNQFLEYIMASSYFPGIKQRKIIDDHYYVDGGFYDNSPVKLFVDKNYDEVYVLNCKGIGFYRKNDDTKINIIEIKPSRSTGMIFELDKSIIRDNIMMGYYDTLRTVLSLDGYKYCFKNKEDNYYEFITRKVDKKLLRRVMDFYNTDSIKEACVKAVEYVLEKENVDYYRIYNIVKVTKKYRQTKNEYFIYRFVSKLKFIF